VEARRTAVRSRVFLTVKVSGPRGEFDARLLDLSARGALIAWSGDAPAPGSEVTLMRGGFNISGRVVRIAGAKCGIEFYEEIDERALLSQPAPSVEAKVPAFVVAPARHLTPTEERRLARTWSVTVGLTVPD
jgi:hypothetical protein